VAASNTPHSNMPLHVMAGILAAISTSLLLRAVLNRSLSSVQTREPELAVSAEPEPLRPAVGAATGVRDGEA